MAPAILPQPPFAAFTKLPIPLPKDQVEQIIEQAETLFGSGMEDYRAGDLDKARGKFDQAVAVLLESKLDINSDPRLSAEFDRLVENIYGVEVAAAEHGEIQSQRQYEPAPIESFADLTFPVDPNVKERVQEEVRSVHSDLPLVTNDLVDGVITYFQGRGRGFIEKILKRRVLYEKTISGELQKQGLPQELIYLAAGESGFNPFAVSRKRAVGIWQFILGTGALYGLKKDRWVDEREDPVKSTQAAAHHLKDLYQTFGDWYLAMAAYDSGPVTVQRAIARTGYADFWKLRELHALPRETENYVPIFIATALIAKDPKAYGFDTATGDLPGPDRVAVSVPTDLRLVAELIGHPVDDLIQLNPSLLRWTTPANNPEFVLYLPPGTKDIYDKAIASVPAEKRIWWRTHRVEGGETLASVASKYRLSASSLAKANEMDRDTELEEGSRLLLPLPPGSEESLVRVRERGVRRLRYYKVRPGDTLDLIADKFDVSAFQIRQWNHLKSSKLAAGNTLRVYALGGSAPLRRRAGRRTSSSPKKVTPTKFSTKTKATASAKPSPRPSKNTQTRVAQVNP
ncbi:MAG: lytic transglycosylase [Acidobacteria bacterium]|nr:MAG: lytic transglycosylase [Acidobacteriota bacterium]